MPFEVLVGLQVNDDSCYAQYREAMTPILVSYGGGFRYDFKIAATLRQESSDPINRVFAIFFRDRNAKDRFYADPEYLKVKDQFFTRAVGARTIIAEYDR